MAQAGSSLTWIIVLAVALLLALITVLMQFAMPKFRIMQKLVDRLNLVSREILTGIMPSAHSAANSTRKHALTPPTPT